MEIATGLGRAPGTIYAELDQGRTGKLDRNSRPQYDPERGQAVYQATFGSEEIGSSAAKDQVDERIKQG